MWTLSHVIAGAAQMKRDREREAIDRDYVDGVAMANTWGTETFVVDYTSRGNWYDSPSVKRTLGITDKRLSCNYCGQQNTIENFDGGCKNCGAPAPRRQNDR